MNNEDIFDNNSKTKIKKPIIYGAIGFLIFVIVVIVAAILQNTTSKKSEDILPPDVNNNPVTETTFKKLKVVEKNNEIEADTNQKTNIENTQINKDELLKKDKIEESEPNMKNEDVKPIDKKENSKKNINPVYTKKEPQENITTSKKVKKSVNKHKVAKKGKYYIQVAALLRNKKPNKKFLELIEKSGFSYKLYHTFINKNHEKIKVTKILVGPFNTKKEAKEALKIVKNKITKTAFIFKVK